MLALITAAIKINAPPEQTIISLSGITSASKPKTAMPKGRKPEYIEPSKPNTCPAYLHAPDDVLSVTYQTIAICTRVEPNRVILWLIRNRTVCFFHLLSDFII